MADFADRKTLSLDGARKAAQAAEAEAKKQSLTVSIAVLDEGGHLLHFSRMDGTGLASAAVAQARDPQLPVEQCQWWYWSRKRKKN